MAGQERIFALAVPAIHVLMLRKKTWMPGAQAFLNAVLRTAMAGHDAER
jgi:hypothetical protein